MIFPPKEVLDDLKEYEKLPETEERKSINNRFMEDEIGSFEFYSLAMTYMRKVTADNTKEQ
ncbi:MAG: hypothetical protein V3U58_03885 [Thermodesulfobacteriota bacterium]